MSAYSDIRISGIAYLLLQEACFYYPTKTPREQLSLIIVILLVLSTKMEYTYNQRTKELLNRVSSKPNSYQQCAMALHL